MAETQEGLARLRARIPRLLLAATASAVAYYVVVEHLVSASTRGCDEGFAGLDCQIARGLSALVLGLVVSALAGVLVLLAFRFPRPNLVAGFSSVNVVFAFVLVKALSTNVFVHIVVLVVAFTIFNTLCDTIFNRSRIGRGGRVVVGVVVIAGTFVPLSWIGLRVESKRETSAFARALDAADFTAYAPARLPTGYRLLRSDLASAVAGTSRAYYEAGYVFGPNQPTDPRPFVVHSFRAPPTFDPPADCGREYPLIAPLARPCSLALTTTSGISVFFADSPVSSPAWYARLGDTEVTVAAAGTGPNLTLDDVGRIYESLRRIGGRQP